MLEWRLDPSGTHRLPEATGFDRPVVVVCSQGYASSLAADSLRALGYRNASDLIGGYQAWLAWPSPIGPTRWVHGPELAAAAEPEAVLGPPSEAGAGPSGGRAAPHPGPISDYNGGSWPTSWQQPPPSSTH